MHPCPNALTPSSPARSPAVVRLLVAAAAGFALVAVSCGAPTYHCGSGQRGRCPSTLGDDDGLRAPVPERSRWKLHVGLGMGTAGLLASGVGTTQLMLADVRRSDAAAKDDRSSRTLLEDKAEAAEDIGYLSLGIGVPLATVGLVLILVDVIEGPPRPAPITAPTPAAASLTLLPGPTGVSVRWGF